MSYRKNITLIDDLPSLDDIEYGSNQNANGLSFIPVDNQPSIQKFIRNNMYNPPYESGMSNNSQPIPSPPSQIKQQLVPMNQAPVQVPMNQIIDDPRNYEQQQMMMFPPQYQQPQPPPPPQQQIYEHNDYITCINVAEHTTNCVVCSRLCLFCSLFFALLVFCPVR